MKTYLGMDYRSAHYY